MANLNLGLLGGIIPQALGINPIDPVNSTISKIEPDHPDIAKLLQMIQQIGGTALGGL